MKKLLMFLFAFSCIISLSGCFGKANKQGGNPSKPTQPSLTEPTVSTDTQDSTEPLIVQLPEPDVPKIWAANCEDRINFRSTPGGELIGTIPKNATMELLEWKETYAKVNYNGKIGYVGAGYIMPADHQYFSECLDVVAITNTYTYAQMTEDMAALKEKHPGIVTVSSIGTSELGREIPVICVGNLDAKKHILLQGAMHAREHITAWLLMAMTEYWLNYNILEHGDICYHIIPMTNPDGVNLVQTQTLSPDQYNIYLNDKANGYTDISGSDYISQWKANGLGVDLNRNFASGWDALSKQSNNYKTPSYMFYRGAEPFSAAEAAALRDYTLEFKDQLIATVSYHSCGSVIYYEYGDKEPVNSNAKDLANAVKLVTGYTPADSTSVSGAGYKDWVMDALEIPSLTIEVGSDGSPVELREIYNIFVRNIPVLPEIAEWSQCKTK